VVKAWKSTRRLCSRSGGLYTPFHISTLLAHTETLNDVLETWENGPYRLHTIDRLIFTHLACAGIFSYNPIADSFVPMARGQLD